MDAKDLEKIAMAIYASTDTDWSGHAIAYSQFRWPGNAQWGNFEGMIDDDRIEALEAGAVPSEQEINLLGRDFLARETKSAGDFGEYVYFCAAPIWIGVPPVLALLARGRNNIRFFGAFDNEMSAWAALKKEFHVRRGRPFVIDGGCSVCGAGMDPCRLPASETCWMSQARAAVEERGDRWFVIMPDASEIGFESKDEAMDCCQDVDDQACRQFKERMYGERGFTIIQQGDPPRYFMVAPNYMWIGFDSRAEADAFIKRVGVIEALVELRNERERRSFHR